MIGNNTMIFDHDHDYKCDGGVRANKYIEAPITIGKNVWIGCGVIILSGAEIGDNSVIAAGSVVNKKIPSGTVFVQKRESSFFSI